MPDSHFYDKYLQSYDFYCNSMQSVAGLNIFILFSEDVYDFM